MCLQGLKKFRQLLFKILSKLSIQKPLRITKGNNSNSIGSYPLIFIISICLEDRNVFARFNEIPSMTLQDTKETVYKSHLELQREITPIVLAPSP